MNQPLPINELRLQIVNNRVTIDVFVDGRWRRIVETYHGGRTDHWISRGAMEIGHFGTTDVTAEYQTQEGEHEP